MSKLQEELLELSKKITEYCNINTPSNIVPLIELSKQVELPYIFKAEALHPGTYKGFTISESEIIKAKDTIFNSEGNFHNYEINKDHKGNRKEGSSVSDVVGKIIASDYNKQKNALILTGEIYDKEIALKIHNGIIKFVSLRIAPGKIVFSDGHKNAMDLNFEEMSLVRAPGDPNAHIIEKQ